MQITKEVTVKTSETESVVAVPELEGVQKPTAFIINSGAHGYAKFIYDELSLSAFEKEGSISKIHNSMERRQIYNILVDMIKNGKIAGSRAFQIIMNNLESETAEDVFADNLRANIPIIVNKYTPEDTHEAKQQLLFDTLMKILVSGRYKDSKSTLELVFTSVLGFAGSESSEKLVYKWLMVGDISDADGKKLEGVEVTLKQKHAMVKNIFASKTIDKDSKKAAFEKLKSLDSSDLLGRTQKYCESAVPDIEEKGRIFKMLLEEEEDIPLTHVQEMCLGMRQFGQRDMMVQLGEYFFEKIEHCISKKAYALTRYIYLCLQPNMVATKEQIDRFVALKEKIEARTEAEKIEGNDRLVKWLKESIQDLEEKKNARELSQAWEQSAGAKL